MATMHRPGFHALRTEPAEQRHACTGFRDAYMFPFINLEDLLKAKNLLLLLNSLVHNKPDVFAYADLKTLQFALTSGAIQPKKLHDCVMLLTGQVTPETYGRLILEY
jgi:hypothetical protein